MTKPHLTAGGLSFVRRHACAGDWRGGASHPDGVGEMRRAGSSGFRDARLFLGERLSQAAEGWCHHDTTVRGCCCVRWTGGKLTRRARVPFHQCARRRAVWLACRSVVSSSFGLSRPMRPRFGMSNRRPSSLRSASIKRPQRPFSAFFPWSLRAHSSRDKKASPWPPSTAWRPFGCGPIASGQRLPSRPRWSRPENQKRIRTWLPSATSP